MSADTMSEPLIERPDPEKKLTSIIEAGKGEVDAANRMLAQAAVVAALCVGGMLTGYEWDDFASFVLGVGLLAATASLTETASDSLANSSSDSSFTGATACYIVDGVQVDGQPYIVCTSEPDETAWFLGIEKDALTPVGEPDSAQLECQMGWSFNGSEEWQCKGNVAL